MLNLLILYIGHWFIHKKKLDTPMAPLMVMVCLNINYIVFHYDSPICILVFLFPILLTIFYADRTIMKYTMVLCIVMCTFIVWILLYINHNIGYDYLETLFGSCMFLMILAIGCMLMTYLEEEKRNLLITSMQERDYYYDRANLDGLTKCHNRASYEKTVAEKVENCNHLLLAIIDIDYFKNVNDSFGHTVGDAVLVQLSTLLNQISSETVYVSRYGGEEFVILFSNHSLKQAEKIIDDIKRKLSQCVFHEMGNQRITFSCGIASKKVDDTTITLFNRADEALYEAKNTGKNKIVIYS